MVTQKHKASYHYIPSTHYASAKLNTMKIWTKFH